MHVLVREREKSFIEEDPEGVARSGTTFRIRGASGVERPKY